MYRWEGRLLREKAINFVAGVDEAGRGPLAGPVVVAAVIVKPEKRFGRIIRPKFSNRIADSKILTSRQREAAFTEIFSRAWVGVGIVEEDLIDNFNISLATERAAVEAIRNLPKKPEHILIDAGIRLPIEYSCTSLKSGDSRSLSIACASIIAKVTRDKIMDIYDSIFPRYAFKKHKGYGTKLHMDLLREYGPSPVHRESFWPLRAWFKR